MADLSNKVSHYSVSSVNSFRNCPRGWWIQKILEQSLPSSAAASFGNQYDELVAHKLGLEPMDVRSRDKGKLHITKQNLVDGVADAVAGYLIQPHAVKKEEAFAAQKMIHIDPSAWAILAEELGLSLDIAKPIVGYIDLISKVSLRRKITDLKTSSRKGMRADWAFQDLIYCIAENCIEADIHLMTTTKVPAYYKYPVIVNNETKAWAMKNFTYAAQAIERALKEGSGENLPAYPDYWCSWCADKLECPAKGAFVG
jgi:hypothetical protein